MSDFRKPYVVNSTEVNEMLSVSIVIGFDDDTVQMPLPTDVPPVTYTKVPFSMS